MKNVLILAALVAAAGWGISPVVRAEATVKKPILRRDFSPVSDGKGGLVASYADVVEPVLKAVVSVYSSKTIREPINPLLRQFFGNIPKERESKQEGLGSGVVVSPDGFILTNNHVVADADELTVAFSDNRRYKARVVGADEKTDVAVIKIEASNLPVVTLADSDKLRVGDIVFAVGNPWEVGETVTMGIVSAKGRTNLQLLDKGGYENFIQTDAAINLGNSGGALVDAKGRLVGINSAIISPSRGNIGIGFAIPVNLAANIMTSLIATGKVTRGYLGVDGQTATAEIAEQFGLSRDVKGVVVTDVEPHSPAEKAGLRGEDVIVEVNATPVASDEELRLLVAEFPPGAKIAVKVLREGKPVTISVSLGQMEEKPNELISGVTAEPLTDELRTKLNIDERVSGLLVTAVAEGSAYADRLAANMVIVSINRTPVADLAGARALLLPGERNLFLIYYQGALSYRSVSIR